MLLVGVDWAEAHHNVSCRRSGFGGVRQSSQRHTSQGLSSAVVRTRLPEFSIFAEVFADCEKNVGVVGSGLTLLLTGRHVP